MAGKTEYKNSWQKENMDRISLVVAKGRKEEIRCHAEAQGKSINGFIIEAIEEKLEREFNLSGAPRKPIEADTAAGE